MSSPYEGPDTKLGDPVCVMMSNGELSKPMIIAQMTYTTPRDAVYRALTRWQRILRALTPKRQRESLLIHPADPGGLSLQFHEVADE